MINYIKKDSWTTYVKQMNETETYKTPAISDEISQITERELTEVIIKLAHREALDKDGTFKKLMMKYWIRSDQFKIENINK